MDVDEPLDISQIKPPQIKTKNSARTIAENAIAAAIKIAIPTIRSNPMKSCFIITQIF